MSSESIGRRRRGGILPTMGDVAQVAGVSPMTVSRALRGSGSIRAETRARILAAAERLGYLPNLAASELASRKSRSVGIVLPTLQDSIYSAVLEGIRQVLEAAGYDYVLQAIAYQRAREPTALRALLARRVQAILIASIGHDQAARSMVARLPIPHVEFGSRSRDNIGAAVGHSDHEAGLVATRRLIERGRRRIALISGPCDATTHARDRRQGYLDALAAAGLPILPSRIVEVDHAVAPAAAALGTILAAHPEIDGLVVGGEIWEPVVMLEAYRRGLKVPAELSIVGIGDFELAPFLPVPMTVVALPRHETGLQAARLLVALCRGQRVAPQVITLPTHIIERASV